MRITRIIAICAVLFFPLFHPVLARAEQTISVPSDPSARYTVLDIETRSDGMVEITTRRQGKSGTSYAKRLIDCRGATFKYLGEGDTLQEMRGSVASTNMGPLVPGSISTYVSSYACQNAH